MLMSVSRATKSPREATLGNGGRKRIHNCDILACISATCKGLSDTDHLKIPPQPFEVNNIRVY